MSNPFPEFERPPIVELVLGVQFAPLAQLTSGHLGWFWKKYLGQEWDRATDAPPVLDQFETFDEQRRWRVPGLELRLESAATPPRLQIGNKDGDRLIQLQATRFHYNWQRRDGHYPSYGQILREFDTSFGAFRSFVEEAGVGKLIPNQWELSYIDCIPQGNLWKSVVDWQSVLPGLFPPAPTLDGLNPESVGGEWIYEITPKRGRLHVSVAQARFGEKKELALMLQMTARGPIGKNPEAELKAGLDLGHEAAVRAFLQITSDRARRYWGLKS